MALSVGTDLAALLTATSPEQGPRRTPAFPAGPQAATLPQGFADLLAGLPEENAVPAAEALPAVATRPVAAPSANATRGGAAAGTEWPWASLAAAAEEVATWAGQFQLPPSSIALPAGDAALPEAPDLPETMDPEAAAAPVMALTLPLPDPMLPPPEPLRPSIAAMVPVVLPGPAQEPAPAPDADMARIPALPDRPALPVLFQPVEAEPAPATAPAQPEAPSAVVVSAPAEKPASAAIARPVDLHHTSIVTPASAQASGGTGAMPSVPDASRTTAAEGPVTVPVLQQMASVPSLPRRSVETRRPAEVENVKTLAVGPKDREMSLPWAVDPVPISDAVMVESLAVTDGHPAAPQPGHLPAAPTVMAPAEADTSHPGSVSDATILAGAPASVAPEPRNEATRAAAASPAASRPRLPPEVGQQLALRVNSAISNRVDSVSVDLRPPELGRVELRLTFHDGTVQVAIAAERGDTFEALRHDRTHLEQQMQQAGLQLGSGGLDLQHGHLPREAPEPPPPSPDHVDGSEAAEEEPGRPRPPRSDSLIDLIA